MVRRLARGTVKIQPSNGRTGRSEKGNDVDFFGGCWGRLQYGATVVGKEI